MKLLIIDAQGGGLGRQIITSIRKHFSNSDHKLEITAVGTNTLATSAMIKAGADHAATGENAVVVGCRKTDVIIGPIGIAIADSMYGEITPTMAVAVGQSDAVKLLIPMNHCNNIVVGVQNNTISDIMKSLMNELDKMK